MKNKMTEDVRQRLVDACIEQIKKDVADGDVEALDELLKFCKTKNLYAFLSDDRAEEFNKIEEEINEFKNTWGQSRSEITANLDYPKSHSESDELLMVDYFWLDETKQWYPKCSSLYTDRLQEIADMLRNNQ